MKRPVLALLRTIRDYRSARPGACRFAPTCTSYAIEAVEIHGTWRGGLLSLRRVGRCNPLGGHGYDPVPVQNEVTHHHA